jgi:hypothetical protein
MSRLGQKLHALTPVLSQNQTFLGQALEVRSVPMSDGSARDEVNRAVPRPLLSFPLVAGTRNRSLALDTIELCPAGLNPQNGETMTPDR